LKTTQKQFGNSTLTNNKKSKSSDKKSLLFFSTLFSIFQNLTILARDKTKQFHMMISKKQFRILKTEQKVKNKTISFLVSILKNLIFKVPYPFCIREVKKKKKSNAKYYMNAQLQI
jgi:hypothetical protein